MSLFSRVQRLLVASGGFILFIGFTMLGLAILGAFDIINIEILLQRFHLLISISAIIGILDIIIGLLLLYPYKGRGRITQKKPLSTMRSLFLLGYLEVGVGINLMVFALFVFLNVNNIQTSIQTVTMLPSDYFPLFIFALFMFGFVFIVNGFFLIDKYRKT